MAVPNLTEITATTIKNYSKTIADNVSNSNALLQRLNSKGNIKPADGGETILQELMYAENTNFTWYSGYDSLDIGASESISAAEYSWKQCAANVVFNGLEVSVKNTGSSRIHNLLEARILATERTMKNKMSEAIYSDGTGYGGKQLTGLLAQVALSPTTGIVGGINRANYSFWQNYTSGDVAQIDSSAVTLNTELRTAFSLTSRGTEKIDLIIMDDVLYNTFWGGLQDIQRITSADKGTKGYASLQFATADVVLENGNGAFDSGIRAATAYLLNTDYIFLRPHPDRNMVPLEKVGSINQDASVIPMVFAGNLTMSNAAMQAVVYT